MAPTEEGFSFWGGRRGVVVPHEHDILGLKCSNSHIQVHQQLFPCSANFKTSNRGGGVSILKISHMINNEPSFKLKIQQDLSKNFIFKNLELTYPSSC